MQPVDGWAVAFCTVGRGLGCPVHSLLHLAQRWRVDVTHEDVVVASESVERMTTCRHRVIKLLIRAGALYYQPFITGTTYRLHHAPVTPTCSLADPRSSSKVKLNSTELEVNAAYLHVAFFWHISTRRRRYVGHNTASITSVRLSVEWAPKIKRRGEAEQSK